MGKIFANHIFGKGKFPWTEEPDGLQSIESQRVSHNWSDLAHNIQNKELMQLNRKK